MSEETREVIVSPTSALAIERAPETVLAEAHRAAAALKSVLDQKPNKIMMGNEQYLEFEDWQTLGRFYGVTAREDGDPEFVEFGDVKGFKASACAITKDGDEVSRATAFCLSDEDKWGSRPKYVWGYLCKDGTWSAEDPGPGQIVWEPNPNKPGKSLPKKERRLTGTESVPLFQLSSMAQTRACAKALRNVLSWVVVLAGYRPTPAEEMDGMATQVRGGASAIEDMPGFSAPPSDVVDGDFREVDDAIPFRGSPTAERKAIPRDSKLWKGYMERRDEARTLLPNELLATLPIWMEPRSKEEIIEAGRKLAAAIALAKESGVSKGADVATEPPNGSVKEEVTA